MATPLRPRGCALTRAYQHTDSRTMLGVVEHRAELRQVTAPRSQSTPTMLAQPGNWEQMALAQAVDMQELRMSQAGSSTGRATDS
jgi:hypothetical protein